MLFHQEVEQHGHYMDTIKLDELQNNLYESLISYGGHELITSSSLCHLTNVLQVLLHWDEEGGQRPVDCGSGLH